MCFLEMKRPRRRQHFPAFRRMVFISHLNLLQSTAHYRLLRNSGKGSDSKTLTSNINVFACEGVHFRQAKKYSTSSQAKHKQLTQASFNLIDNVLNNNTAYFDCNASKLTAVKFFCSTLWGGSLRLWRRAWWKDIKTGGEMALTHMASQTQPSIFVSLNEVKHQLK